MTPERIAELRAIPRASFTNNMRTELLDEIERLTAELDAAQLRSIEARNPGIDMDEVKRMRARTDLAALRAAILDGGGA